MAGAEDYPDWLMSEEPLDARAHDAGARPNGDAEGATGRPGSARVDSSGRESSEMTPPGASFPSGAGDQGGTQCMQCGTENTPLWRTIGREILCNACGLRRMRASRSGIKRPNKKKLLANLPSSCQPKPRSKPGSAKSKKVVLKVKHRRKRTFAREDSPEEDNGNVRRGKRKRKANVLLQRQYISDLPRYESDDDLDQATRRLMGRETGKSGAASAEEIREFEALQSACQALADLDGDRTDDEWEEESLCDGELDIILKMHEVYRPATPNLFTRTVKSKEGGTLLLAIVIRATMNLFKAGKISHSERLDLLDKISLVDLYLKSLPLATSSMAELEDLLLEYLQRHSKEKKEKEEKEKEEALAPAPVPFTEVPSGLTTIHVTPPTALGGGVDIMKLNPPVFRMPQIHTPVIAEPRPMFPF